MAGKAFGIVFVSLLLTGCASLPTDYEKPYSTAFKYPERTTLGRFFASSSARHPGESGFLLLDKSRDAFAARVALADMAEKTIDVQYYIWKPGLIGDILAERLLRAADRGVRVRVLVDDMYMGGKEFGLVAFATHPNIELRLFNPFAARRLPGFLRTFELVFNVSRLKHRMHNKLFAVDNQIAIVGGRNIADPDFGIGQEFNFRDLDVVTVGSVVEDLSEGFDQYWNSDWAVPVHAFNIDIPTPQEAEEMYTELRAFVAAQEDFPYDVPDGKVAIIRELSAINDQFIWTRADAVYDTPEKARGDVSQNLGIHMVEMARATKREILAASSYLMWRPEDVSGLAELHRRGVTVRILTNSLASTNIVIAHASYSKNRKSILEAGAQLYELRPDAAVRQTQTADPSAPHRLCLHTKAAVFDRKVVFIGSYNFNTAGDELSTEIGVFVYSPELAQQVAAVLEDDMRPENSWQVVINDKIRPGSEPRVEISDVLWVAQQDGKEIRYDREPGVSLWRGLGATFFSLLPI